MQNMEPLERLFGDYVKDLAPGIPDPSRVVMERILYRSGEEKSQLPLKGFKGDSMDIDLNDFTMPLDAPKTVERKQTPKTKIITREKDIPEKKSRVNDETDRLDSIKELESIEDIGSIESGSSKALMGGADEYKKEDDSVNKKEEKTRALSTEDKEDKDNSADDEDESENLLMSLVNRFSNNR